MLSRIDTRSPLGHCVAVRRWLRPVGKNPAMATSLLRLALNRYGGRAREDFDGHLDQCLRRETTLRNAIFTASNDFANGGAYAGPYTINIVNRRRGSTSPSRCR